MEPIIFSSWGGRLVDNRGKESQAGEAIEPESLPEFFNGKKIKAFIGWDGIILRSPDLDVLDLIRVYLEALQESSKTCGKCNYCTTGFKELLEVLTDIFSDNATEEDLEFFKSAAQAIMDSSKCTIGKSGPLPVFHGLTYFADQFVPEKRKEMAPESVTYYSKLTAPCMNACPIHLDIPKYVELIKDAKFADSLSVIRECLPLPGVVGRVCFNPCEKNCRRANVDGAIAIRALKRFVADKELSGQEKIIYPITPSEKTGKVAMIGSGPAGLACAYHLARKGHQVTLFEKQPLLGGMLALGIPPYRLPRDILETEIQGIQDLGVAIVTGVEFGKEVTLEKLLQEGFSAVFLATGLPASQKLNIPGEDLPGVLKGVDFLKAMALAEPVPLGNTVVVIGGGNVAIDVARTALRKGAREVKLVCLENREEMPAWADEIQEALEEGVEIINSWGPKQFLEKANQRIGIALRQCTQVFNEQRIFCPEYDESKVMEIQADTVIVAIGQAFDRQAVQGMGFEISPKGLVEADPITLETHISGVFAGGDCFFGPKSVVEASATGKRAAENIDRYINGLPLGPGPDDHFDQLFQKIKLYDPDEHFKGPEPRERKQPDKLPLENRKDTFDEVELGFSSPEAVVEAERCLRCYRVVTLAV